MKNRQLFEHGSYEQTDRMKSLMAGEITPTQRDMAELWLVAKESEDFTGVVPTLGDFVEWLTEGAEVTW